MAHLTFRLTVIAVSSLIWILQAQSQPEYKPLSLSGHTYNVSAIAFSADGNLISGSRDKTLKVWDRFLELAKAQTSPNLEK